MIILFGNQKGGCGKTTNCIQFANYLVEKGKEVLVLDLDFQRSLSDRRKKILRPMIMNLNMRLYKPIYLMLLKLLVILLRLSKEIY